jgi:ABC-2 type transport system permease protein
MLSALLYLRVTSSKNWMYSRARRLRQPKYALGAIVAFAYFYFFFFRNLGRAPGTRSRPPEANPLMDAAAAGVTLPTDWLPLSTAIGAVMLLVFVLFSWLVPARRAALGFSEAEIAFLFPAPIKRRGLIHFKLVSSQFRSLFGAAIMMLFSHRWTFLGGSALTHAIGWWFIFSGLSLHFRGANFTLTRLNDRGLGAWKRRILILAGVIAIIAITLAQLPEAERMPAPADAFDARPFAQWLLTLSHSAPMSWLLWPFKTVMGPFLAGDTRAFLLTLGPALAVIGFHYLWVVRSAVAFEDSAIDYAEKRAARLAAWEAGGTGGSAAGAKARQGPFMLGGFGRPELAFLWKNLLSTWPYFTVQIGLGAAVILTAALLWIGAHPTWRGLLPGIAAGSGIFAAYTLIVGPQFARQDIRSDLGHADIIKTYPLAGWQIILGELLTPTAILSGILWLSILTGSLALYPLAIEAEWLTSGLHVVITLGLAALIPLLVALQLLVPNAAALLFPGWFQTSRIRGGGPEVMGQRMIFFFAQVVTMVLALLPAVALGALLLFTLHVFIGPIVAVTAATLAMAFVLAAEVSGGIWLLGRRFEHLDLSTELRAS